MSNQYGIVIPHYSTKPHHTGMLIRCLRAIEKHEPELLPHTVVIDDGSPIDSGMKKIRELFPQIITMTNLENLGFAKTVNKGIKLFRKYCDYILLLNNDVELGCQFRDRITKIFTALPQTAIIGNLLLYPTGRIQSAGFGINIEYKMPYEYEKGVRYEKSIHARQSRFQFGVTGAMQFLRSSHLETIGFYDERFGLGYEDVELCHRCWQLNRHVFYDSLVWAVHSESATRGIGVGPREIKSYYHWKNMAKDDEAIYQITRVVEELNRKAIQRN